MLNLARGIKGRRVKREMSELIIGEGMTIHRKCEGDKPRFVRTEVVKTDLEIRIGCLSCGNVIERWLLK